MGIGRISYGAYLCHNVVFVTLFAILPYEKFRYSYDITVVVYIVGTIVLAYARFQRIERPLSRPKDNPVSLNIEPAVPND